MFVWRFFWSCLLKNNLETDKLRVRFGLFRVCDVINAYFQACVCVCIFCFLFFLRYFIHTFPGLTFIQKEDKETYFAYSVSFTFSIYTSRKLTKLGKGIETKMNQRQYFSCRQNAIHFNLDGRFDLAKNQSLIYSTCYQTCKYGCTVGMSTNI